MEVKASEAQGRHREMGLKAVCSKGASRRTEGYRQGPDDEQRKENQYLVQKCQGGLMLAYTIPIHQAVGHAILCGHLPTTGCCVRPGVE